MLPDCAGVAVGAGRGTGRSNWREAVAPAVLTFGAAFHFLEQGADRDRPVRLWPKYRVSEPLNEEGTLMATPDAITVTQLVRLVGTPDAPVLVDVRIDNDHASDPRMLPASVRRDYRTVSSWAGEYAGRSVVVVCQRGQKLSAGRRGVAAPRRRARRIPGRGVRGLGGRQRSAGAARPCAGTG